MNINIAYIYVTVMIRTSAYSVVVGLIFLPIIYFILLNKTIFWPFLLIVIIYSFLTGQQDARHRFSVLKKNLPYYVEIGSFWKNERGAFLMPKIAFKFFYYNLKTTFILGESNWALSSCGLYLIVILVWIYFGKIEVRANLEGVFIILSTYAVMSFHLFFIFLYWKYKIAKKIEGECGLNYKALISVD